MSLSKYLQQRQALRNLRICMPINITPIIPYFWNYEVRKLYKKRDVSEYAETK